MCVAYVNTESILVNLKGLPLRSPDRVLLLHWNLCLLRSANGKSWSSQLHHVTDEKINVCVVTDICYSDQLECARKTRLLFACSCTNRAQRSEHSFAYLLSLHNSVQSQGPFNSKLQCELQCFSAEPSTFCCICMHIYDRWGDYGILETDTVTLCALGGLASAN